MSEQSQTTVIIASSVHHHSFTWTIVNFSKISDHIDFVKQSISSNRREPPLESRLFKFNSSNSSWRIVFYPNYYKGDYGPSYVNLELKYESKDPDVHQVTPTMALIDSAGVKVFIQSQVLYPNNFPSFLVERQEILKAKERYLPKDILTLNCELEIVCKSKAVDIESRLESRKVSKIPVDFEVLFEKPKFSEVIIHCDGSMFRAHREILADASPVFASMFQHDFLESTKNEVHISDIKAATMERLLCYIYGKKIGHLLPVDYMDLYEAADEYQLLELKQHCASVIVIHLNSEVVCEVAMLADMHNDSSLFTSVQDFVKKYVVLGSFVTSKSFVDFKQKSPVVASRLISS